MPTTRCHLDDCRDVAHVVLYASGNQFAGQPAYDRQPVVLCLKHGGEVYDVIKAWRTLPSGVDHHSIAGPALYRAAACPTWLVTDLRNDRLPRVSPDPKGWPAASLAALNKPRNRR
jgi:hypothetical protein